MANIVILGAGVMGSALAVPPASLSNNTVTLIGSPLDDNIIRSIQKERRHPTLNASIPDSVQAMHLADATAAHIQSADIVVIGVSSGGIKWASSYLNSMQARPAILALVTKGLVPGITTESPPLTYADALPASLNVKAEHIVGIGGPCIARELALGYPTRVTFASANEKLAIDMRRHFQTSYYRITTHSNIVALEACAALKNFLCIGVSAMLSAYPLDDNHAKNPVAALYNQAVRELFILSQWIGKSSAQAAQLEQNTEEHVAFDLAGMGDLHVTVGGGRNSRLGVHLGNGSPLGTVLSTSMAGITVEGVDTGKVLLSSFTSACTKGILDIKALPLTDAILNCIASDDIFAFEFEDLPG